MKRVDSAVILTEDEHKALVDAKPKLCTSKKLLYTILVTTIVLTVLTVIGVFCTNKDMTVMGIVTSLSWGVTAADAAVYSAKAKAENKIKLFGTLIKELDATTAVEVARIVLTD